MSSRRFGSARFIAYPQDHEPRHVHAFIGEAEIIIDLREDGSVALAARVDAVRPANAKRNDTKRALALAADHFDELVELWEEMHGEHDN